MSSTDKERLWGLFSPANQSWGQCRSIGFMTEYSMFLLTSGAIELVVGFS